MSHPRLLLAALVTIPVIFFTGCESLDLAALSSGAAPSVSVTPLQSPPKPGYVRSGEIFTGKTSWYSVRTNGGTRTASGEKFADHGETAAHRTLPFGTLVEVTNLANEQSIVLKINDRGPYKHGRVLDVSIGAAKKLGFDKHGLANCSIEVLRPVTDQAAGAGDSEPEGSD